MSFGPGRGAAIGMPLMLLLMSSAGSDAQTPGSSGPTGSGPTGSGPTGSPARSSGPVEQPRRLTPFDRGSMRVSLGGGGGVYGGASYFAIAGGFSYFVWHGVELGVDLAQWFGSDPNVTHLSPQLRYVFYQLAPLSPYLGVFYRHWFRWAGQSDFDTIGARGGVLWQVGGRLYLGLGAAYERLLDTCDSDCYAVYPEVALVVTF
jgi:hypothetical protein